MEQNNNERKEKHQTRIFCLDVFKNGLNFRMNHYRYTFDCTNNLFCIALKNTNRLFSSNFLAAKFNKSVSWLCFVAHDTDRFSYIVIMQASIVFKMIFV